MIDVSRRMFCFGATATLILPKPKTFFIIEPPKLIRPTKPFDLPLAQMLSLMRKLDEREIKMGDIPRWVVVDQRWYDEVVASGN